MSKSIHVGKSPRIRINSVDGDLSIIGWDGEDMLIKADVDEVVLAQVLPKSIIESTFLVSYCIS